MSESTATSRHPRANTSKLIGIGVFLVAVAVGLCFVLRPSPYRGPYRHVVLISLDTVRADHLACYGDGVTQTPTLDRLAGEGIRFDQAVSPAPTTLAAHTSLMTGTYAHRHGVPRNGFLVDPANRMLAEALQESGFTTAGFIGAFPLDRCFGFAQGFDHFDQQYAAGSTNSAEGSAERSAGQVTDAALAYLDRGVPGRLFLFVHYFDAHAPFAPPAPFDGQYSRTRDFSPPRTEAECIDPAVARRQRAVLGKSLGRVPTIVNGLPRALLDGADGVPEPLDTALDALYRGEISYADQQLGRLLEGLRSRGILDHAIVILTSDHGETMWEHGDFWNHGLWVYDTTVRVPLIIRLPGATHAGTVVRSVVSTVDVTPTLLDLLTIPAAEPLDGRSLVAAWTSAGLAERAAFSEATQPYRVERSAQGWPNELKPRCVRDGAWKYIEAPYLRYRELYNVQADPGERENLLLNADTIATAQAATLSAKLAAWSRSAEPLPTRMAPRDANGSAERLKSLGYIGDDAVDEP